MDKRKQYRPLVIKTVENFQIQHLARKFDFSKESRIARLIVLMVNETMEKEERKIGIKRVKPFELYIKIQSEDFRLPLFTPDYLKPIYRGFTFRKSRQLIRDECLSRLRDKLPQTKEEDLLRIIEP